MIGRLHHLAIDCPEPLELARFYSALLGKPITYESEDWVVVASILSDKDADAVLQRLAGAGRVLVATASHSARALPADELARLAQAYFDTVETVADPGNALARARELAGDDGAVLVTGSLYLLADLIVRLQHVPWDSSASA